MRSFTRIMLFGMVMVIILFLIMPDEESVDLQESFDLEAVYEPNFGLVTITFSDSTRGTTETTLEVLGLARSYQRTYDGYTFVETIQFGSPPQLGWEAHPVTVAANHPSLGTVNIKTEVYPQGGERPEVIVGMG